MWVRVGATDRWVVGWGGWVGGALTEHTHCNAKARLPVSDLPACLQACAARRGVARRGAVTHTALMAIWGMSWASMTQVSSIPMLLRVCSSAACPEKRM